ncbi:hypothetical protein [Campylobacter sp. US33a]|uniref:hypothetical protein n=1 Tax=Campylobacter sp. US33a TaxID=2498120 RepID=UPI001068B757|nr:hypothetical protein [Campylobacter sp. US33a]TEY00723.1 hypothetical protein ELQ16_08800 [Campylobacter sp. US33a]
MAEENKEGILCPICGNGRIKVSPDNSYIHCEFKKVEKQGKEFVDVGECKFRIFFNQSKSIGRTLNRAEVKKLLNGEGVKNAKGDTLYLDKENEAFYTRVEWAEKKPSTDLL